MKQIIITLLLISSTAFADYKVSGQLSGSPDKLIELKGYDMDEYLLSSTQSDDKGNFTLRYSDGYTGAAKLQVNNREINLLLNQENFTIINTTAHLSPKQKQAKRKAGARVGLHFNDSLENQIFIDFVTLQNTTNSKLQAWKHLLKLYSEKSAIRQNILSEINLLVHKVADFIKQIDPELYVKDYIKIHNLIQQMPRSVLDKNYQVLMQQHQADFNALDFTERNLLSSGLLPQLFRTYFVMLESLGAAKQYPHMNRSIDKVLASVQHQPALLEKISLLLWDYLERRSSFKAAEHLSMTMLDKYGASNWPPKQRGRFEKYRRMAKDQLAPDLSFIKPDAMAKYKVVIFWESSCEKCIKELVALNKMYPAFKKKGVEIIAISLDKDPAAYQAAIADFNFPTYNDFKGWEGKAVQDYFIYKLPIGYFLDDKQTILTKYRITNALQVEALVERGGFKMLQ